MLCRYETRIVAACPVDGGNDVYDVTIESDVCIPVEDIIAAMQPFAQEKLFQEVITERLARILKCRVTTIGFHSGVKTTVYAP